MAQPGRNLNVPYFLLSSFLRLCVQLQSLLVRSIGCEIFGSRVSSNKRLIVECHDDTCIISSFNTICFDIIWMIFSASIEESWRKLPLFGWISNFYRGSEARLSQIGSKTNLPRRRSIVADYPSISKRQLLGVLIRK